MHVISLYNKFLTYMYPLEMLFMYIMEKKNTYEATFYTLNRHTHTPLNQLITNTTHPFPFRKIQLCHRSSI